jgi:hypothetical protein
MRTSDLSTMAAAVLVRAMSQVQHEVHNDKARAVEIFDNVDGPKHPSRACSLISGTFLTQHDEFDQ